MYSNAVASLFQRVGRFLASNLRVVRASGKLGCIALLLTKIVFVKVLTVFLGLTLCFLLGFTLLLILLGLHRKLLGLDFFFRHLHFAVEAYAIALGEKYMLVVVAVPVLAQHRRNVRCCIVFGEQFGVGDIVVVGDTAVLRHFLVVGRHEQVCLIAVSHIRTIHGVVEMRRTLVGIVTTAIDIVEFEAHADALACVNTKFGSEMVFSRCPAARCVERDVGERRERIGKMELVYGGEEKIVGLGKDKLAVLGTVYEYPVGTRGTQIASGVVLSTQTSGENGVGEHVRQGVGHGKSAVPKPLVYGPNLDTLGYLLVTAETVGVLPTLRGRDKLPVGIDLVELVTFNLCIGRGDPCTGYINKGEDSLLH